MAQSKDPKSAGPTPPPGKNATFFVPGEVIVLNKQGEWLADGIEITHEPTRRMFASHLRRDAEGYFIQLGYEAKRITVEDTPYFIHRIDRKDSGAIELWLNDESREELDPATLSYRPGRLTCWVKKGSEEAKLLHAAYFDLLTDLQENDAEYFLIVGGKRVRLATK